MAARVRRKVLNRRDDIRAVKFTLIDVLWWQLWDKPAYWPLQVLGGAIEILTIF
jgi:hypothetical protein